MIAILVTIQYSLCMTIIPKEENNDPTFQDEAKRHAAMRKDMLNLFGVKFRPNPELFGHIGRNMVSAKKYMYNLYKFSVTSEDFLRVETNVSSKIMKDADTVVSFGNTNALIPRPNASDEAGSMFFNLESNLVVESTLASELRIFLDVTKKALFDSRLRVTVYEIVVPRKQYRKLVSLEINATSSAWHGLDVIEATKRWKQDTTSNKGVLVVCQTLDGKIKSLAKCGLIDFKSDSENKPFLVSFYQSGNEEEILAEQVPKSKTASDDLYDRGKQRRRRRGLNGLKDFFPHVENLHGGLEGMVEHGFPSKKNNASSCTRKPLYIGFKDLGWSDWIMAPDGYKASFCGGECKFARHYHANTSTNHALIQTLVNLMAPSTVPPPCCAPIRLDPLQVLFLDERDNVIMKKYANMVVNDCACQ